MMKHNRGIWSIFFTTFKSFICEKPKAWAVMTILSLLTALGTPIKVYLEKVIFNAAETVALEKIISTELFKVFLVAVGVQLLYVVIYPQFRCHGNYFGSEFETILQRRLNKKTAKLDLEVYENSSLYSDISAASSASRELRFMVMMFSSEILVYAFQFLMVSYILSSFHIALVILSFLAVLPDVLAKYMKSKWQYKVFDQSQPIFVRKNYYENLLLSPDSVKELRVSGAQNLLKEVWGKEKSLYNEEKWKVQKKAFFLDLFIQLCNVISVFCTYTISIYLTMNGSISLGEFGASLGAVSTLKTNFSRICDLAMFSFECGLKGKNYYRVLDYSEEQKGKNSEISLDSGIKLDNVSFTYPKGTRVIRNISLKIKPGEKIAIVGKNGSGKSTLSKLILGLYHPNSGQVFYGNSDINIINKNIVYDKCSAVFQDFCRYSLSVQDNISISSTKETLDVDKIKRLCEHIKIGGIDSDNIPNQKLGKEFGGSELSGGGWQKLAIIRGLYRQHELIVFDEPTAALDPLVESEIISDMLNIDQASIKIYVTHRLNSVKYADKVVVLQDGEIVGFGPHSELIEQNEAYRELWESQAHWYV